MSRSLSHVGLLVGLVGCLLALVANGQTGVGLGATSSRKILSDPDVPVAALQTNEGRHLADQLRQLRRSLAAMGSNHPSLNAVRAEIDEVKRRLATYASALNSTGDGGLPSPQPTGTSMTDSQLRELVIQMATKIEQLETRVFVLERQLQSR